MAALLLLVTCFRESSAQCTFAASIQTPVNTCLGISLNVSSANALSKIVWEKEGSPVATELAALDYDPHGITVAGDIISGSDNSHFNSPSGVAVDAAGNIYVSDFDNDRVMKWVPGASSGVVVAGGNGPGNAANQLSGAGGIWVTPNGDLYVVDQSNHRVQKWTSGATVGITVAGGNGQGSAPNQLSFPTAIFMDASNTLYISDFNNNRVQKWVAGAISGTTVAGGNGYGDAANQLSNPAGIFVDLNNNVFVTDPANSRVQEWAPGAGFGVTVAGGNGQGNASNQLNVPDAIWVDANGNLFISDNGNNRIQEWAAGIGFGKTIAGTGVVNNTDLGLSDPVAIFMDKSGNLFVADALNYRVQEFKLKSTISQSFTPTIPGSYTTVITDQSGCTITTNSITINPYVTPSISVSMPNKPICVGSAASFLAVVVNGGDHPSYQWQLNGVNTGTNSPEYNNPNLVNGDVVHCVLTSNAVCSISPVANSEDIVINVSQGTGPVVTIAASADKICSGDPLTLSAKIAGDEPGFSYQWLLNGSTTGSDNPVFTSSSFINGDMVECKISDASGSACSTGISNVITITVENSPVITNSEVSTAPGQSLVLDPVISGEVSIFIWIDDPTLSSLNIEHPVATPVKNTVYSLEIISPEGCAAKGQITVNIFSAIKIPNVFSPNHDGKNDVFFVMGNCENCSIRSFEVFNRWGQPVFHVTNSRLNDPRSGWNGNSAQGALPEGTYVYTITIEKPGGTEIRKGTVILVR